VADGEAVVDITDDWTRSRGTWQQADLAAPELGTAARWTKGQQAAAAVITHDARCTPVLVRACIVGRARMPRAALEVATPTGEVLGHVTLPNTSGAFDPQQRFWLVGEPAPGNRVALVSEGRTQVILPGSRLRPGPAAGPSWSDLAARMLGWQRASTVADAPPGWGAVFAETRGTIDGPGFVEAVRRFRTAAVTLPVVFFLVCFPYLFVIPGAVRSGTSTVMLLALPVVGGGLMTAWAASCRRAVAREAEAIEPGAARFGKEIAFTQSYWSGMRKAPTPWEGPLPLAAT